MYAAKDKTTELEALGKVGISSPSLYTLY